MSKVVALVLVLLAINYSLQDDTDDNEEKCTKVVSCEGEKTGVRCSKCYLLAPKKELQERGYNTSGTDRSKLYGKCMFSGYKILSEDGEIRQDALKTYIFIMAPSDKIAETAYQKCAKKIVKGANSLETVYKIRKCLRENQVYSRKLISKKVNKKTDED